MSTMDLDETRASNAQFQWSFVLFLYKNQTQPDARKGRLPEPFVVQDLVSNFMGVRCG